MHEVYFIPKQEPSESEVGIANNNVLNSPAYRRSDNKKNDIYIYIVPRLTAPNQAPGTILLGYCHYPSSPTDGCVIKYDTLTDVKFEGNGGVPGHTLPHEIGKSLRKSCSGGSKSLTSNLFRFQGTGSACNTPSANRSPISVNVMTPKVMRMTE